MINIDNNWVALHAFYQNYHKYDEFICEIVDKLQRYKEDNLIDKWFFIRYWDGGPHFRFRFLNPKSVIVESEITKAIRDYILSNPSENKITREDYYKNSKFDGRPMNIDELPWYDEGEVVKIEYEPEILRYGGENVMEFSESLFMESSYLVKDLLLATKSNFSKKLMYSSAITYILAKDLMEISGESNVNKFLDLYIDMWRNFTDSTENEDKLKKFLEANANAIETIKEGLLQKKIFKEYLEKIKNIFSKIVDNIQDPAALKYIIASHIHMTNNRFGVTPVYEYYISETLSKVYS